MPAPPMRILHVTPFYEPAWAYGGMARAASELCRALARRGHDIVVVTAQLDPAHAPDETLGGVSVRRFAGPGFLGRRLVPWAPGLASFIQQLHPAPQLAHLHGHRNGLAVAATRALASAGIPWLLQPHGTYPLHDQHVWAKRLFDRLAGRRSVGGARRLLAVSAAEARELPEPALVVPNGVRPPAPASTAAREPRRLLFVGSDAPQKRGSLLPAVLGALPGVRLELVGRFGRGFVAAFGAFGERLVVSGVLEGQALADAYARAAIVVHPARSEAFGLVPFEAALFGTPAVVAGGHGCGEWVARAGGAVVPPDDVPALVAALRLRLDDPSIGAREAAAVAAFARRELQWEQVAGAVEALYQSLLAEGSPATATGGGGFGGAKPPAR